MDKINHRYRHFQEKLKNLYRHLSLLKEDHAQLLNRLESDRDEDVRMYSGKQLKFIKNMIGDLETQIRSHIEPAQELKAKAELLLTIPAVGEVLC